MHHATHTPRRLRRAAALLPLLLLAACAAELEGPKPSISGEPGSENPPASPGFACNEQADTWVEVQGVNFSPLVVDALHPDREPSLLLPSVTLTRAASIEGDTDAVTAEVTLRATQDDATQLRWLAPGRLLLRISPDLALPPGVYDLRVNNPNGAATTAPGALGILPRPSVAAVRDDLVCVQQGERAVTLTGDHLLVQAGMTPSLTLGDLSLTLTDPQGCRDLAPVFGGAQVCTQASATLPQDALPEGAYDAVVTNNPPAACASLPDEDQVRLFVVPPPEALTLLPEPICAEQLDYDTMRLTGQHLLRITEGDQTRLPTVTIDGQTFAADLLEGCTPLDGPVHQTAEVCDALTFSIPAGSLTPGRLDVSVENPLPAGCTSTQDLTLTVVPPPTLTEVAPQPVCNAQGETIINLQGSGFLTVDGAAPTVLVEGQPFPGAPSNCTPVEGPAAATQTCTTLQVALPEATFPSRGDLTVSVVNPDPAACTTTQDVTLAVVPAPTVSAVEPQLFCTAGGATTLTLTGQHLLDLGGDLPTLTLGDTTFNATDAQGCEPLADLPDAMACTSITVEIPAGGVEVNTWDVLVQNPEPAACTNPDPGALQVVVAGAPVITSPEPPVVCRGQFDGELTLRGQGFYAIDDNLPTLTLNDNTPLTITDLLDCQTVTGLDNVQACAGLRTTIPPDQRDADVVLHLVNPAPADCAEATLTLPIEEPPRIDDVQPLKICSTGGMLDLTGDHFAEGMTVTLDGTPAETVTVSDPQHATATWAGPLDATNPTGCADTFDTELRITDGPVVFFVDPPVTWSGISIRATVFLGNLFGGSVQQVLLTGDDGNPIDLAFNFDPATPNRLQAVVPSDLPPGAYDVTLIDEVDCAGTTEDLLRVTDDLTVSVAQVTPPFGWTQSNTPVVITGDTPPPNGLTGFDPTPRTYINPANPDEDDIAVELRATTLISDAELNGVVASGLLPGPYDVIVVNPDGTVGVLEDAFQVTQDPPPTVQSVAPGSWETGLNALSVTVLGDNFRAGAVTTAECIDSSGNPIASPPINTAVTSAQQLTLTVNTSPLAHLSTCALRVTNDDGTFEEYSPVTVTNPAGNFVSFRPGNALGTPRRAPAVTAATPSRTARFLYAFGGDSGAPAGALDTAELAPLDRFGTPGAWRPARQLLPAPRTLVQAARLDDFIYLPGGHDGAGPTADLLRALVLDPLNVPVINNVDFEFSDDAGLDTGVYIYRVAAVLRADHPANPGGETLPSEPQPLFVPTLAQRVHVTLSWADFEGVDTWRIYRSPLANLPFGQEELIAELPADQTSFTDDGATPTQAGVTPLPIGALGAWHTVATLDTPRFNHGVALAPDPMNPDRAYLYALGGQGEAGALSSIEIFAIDRNGPRDQTITPVNTAATLPAPRAELGALTATPANADLLAPQSVLLYVLSGRDGNTNRSSVERAAVLPGGDLGAFTNTGTITPFRSGYACAIANNALVAVGGQNSGPSASGASSAINNAQGDLDNWNSLGQSNLRSRYLGGYATFNGALYILGGRSDAAQASTLVDLSTLGGVP